MCPNLNPGFFPLLHPGLYPMYCTMSLLMTKDEMNRWLVFASWVCVPRHGEVHK